mgnify:CR=1 FL=1
MAAPRVALAAPAEDEPATEPAPDDGEEARKSDSLERAMDAYNRGQEHYRRARYKEALVAFKEASTLYASPDFQYNIARCYEKLEQYDEAILAYQTYLSTKPDASDREDVEASIEFLQQKAAEEEKRKNKAATPTPTPTPTPSPVDEPPQPRPDRPLIIAGAVVGGVGAALALGGGIGFGIAAQRRSDDVLSIQEDGNPDGATRAETETIADEGRRFETLQIAFAAGGGVLVVAGAALLAVGFANKKHNKSLQTAVVPSFGRGFAGVGLTRRF